MTRPSSKRAVLPDDLHREIILHLDPHLDRCTLLNLALCSLSLRDESQRLLFGNMDLVHKFDRYYPDIRSVWVHVHFLQAIITSPERLARYVHSYFQYRIASEPECMPVKLKSKPEVNMTFLHSKIQLALGEKVAPDRVHVWRLTERALPLMHSLKHFAFHTSCGHRVAPAFLSQDCVFQLESFDTNMGEHRLHEDVLPQQSALRHLGFRKSSHSEVLDRNPLPRLTSLECTYAAFVELAVPGRIFAWCDDGLGYFPSFGVYAWPPGLDPTDALRRLKYLKLCMNRGFYDVSNTIGLPNLVLLISKMYTAL